MSDLLGVPTAVKWVGAIGSKSAFQTAYNNWPTHVMIVGYYNSGGHSLFIGMKTSSLYASFFGSWYGTLEDTIAPFALVYNGSWTWSNKIENP